MKIIASNQNELAVLENIKNLQKMPRKGISNNPLGRPIGIPNKTTGALRELINNFLENHWHMVIDDFNKLSPKDRLIFYERLLQYGLPKMSSMDFKKFRELNARIRGAVKSAIRSNYREASTRVKHKNYTIMDHLRLVTIDDDEYKSIKIRALFNSEHHLLFQLQRIKEWGGRKVWIIEDFEGLMRSSSRGKLNNDESYIIMNKELWLTLRRSAASKNPNPTL